MPLIPSWLPSDAIIYADFVNGHYWADGAERTAADLFYSTDYGGPFDLETAITASGLKYASPGINQSYISALVASGFSAVFEADFDSVDQQGNSITLTDETDNDFKAVANFRDSGFSGPDTISWFDDGDEIDGTGSVNTGSGVHKCGYTITPTGWYYTRDGQDGEASAPFSWTTPSPNAIILHARSGHIKNIAFYAPISNGALQAKTA